MIQTEIEEIKGKVIAVWFSCGAASAVAAKLTVEKYGKKNNILIVNNPVIEEHPDNPRFLKDVEKWIGLKIISASNKNYLSNSAIDVWDKRKYMSGTKGAPCTVELKKEARKQFETSHKIDFHVLGFTVDEKDRHERFVKYERSNVIPILIDANKTKGDCFNFITESGIDLPFIYKLGFPNANCIGCVKSTSPTYWNLVREKFPEVFQQRCEQSRKIKCRLVRVKGKRKFLDELLITDKGRKIKMPECGIFCETKIHKP